MSKNPLSRGGKPALRALPKRGAVAALTVGMIATGATVAVAEVTTPNPVTLAAVGPTSSDHGFPVWYQDSNGLRLEQCIDMEDEYCDPAFLAAEMPNGDSPISFPGNWPMESFYFQGGSVMDMPGGGGAGLVLALEATFANEAVQEGDQVVFGRLRMDIDFPGAGTYEVVHPYGVDRFTVSAAEADGFRYVEDITPAPGNFALALKSRINPFLVDAEGMHTTANGTYVGHPAEETLVTGSPHGTNFFEVASLGTATDGTATREVIARNDLFSLMGKVSTNSGIQPHKAILSDDGSGQFIDVYAGADAGKSVSVDDGAEGGIAKTAMTSQDTRYFARIQVDGAAPAEVIVTNESDKPVASKTIKVTDEVTVTGAAYDADAKTLTVTAASSDTTEPPALTLDGFDVALTDGTATVSDVIAPPAKVTVSSAAGGSGVGQVSASGSAVAAPPPPVVTTAVITGPTAALTGQTGIELSGLSSINATTFEWALPDGVTGTPSPDGSTLIFDAPATEGPVTIGLTVTNGAEGDALESDTAEHVVQVTADGQEPPAQPVAAATSNRPDGAYLGQSVTISSEGSNNGTVQWEQLSGTSVDIGDGSQPGYTFAMPNGPVTFQVTVTGADGSTPATATVTVDFIEDVLTATGQLRTGRNEWRLNGTATVSFNNTVTIYATNDADTARTELGTATVNPPGVGATDSTWTFRVRGVPAPGATRLYVESTRGGSAYGTYTTRN